MLKHIKFSIDKCSVIQFLGKKINSSHICIITELEMIIISQWDLGLIMNVFFEWSG